MTEPLLNTFNGVVRITRQLIEKMYPEDRTIFELTLGRLNHWPQRWQDIPPDEWRAEDLLAEASSEGFCSPGIIPEETPPWAHFGVVVAAVAEHFKRLGKIPKNTDIEATYKKFGTNAQLSSKVLEIASPTVVELVQAHLYSCIYSIPSTHQYVVYEGIHKYSFTEEKKLEKFRSRKNEYDIYVDDPRSEILVKGKEPDKRPGETDGFRLLKCLLEKVGDHWTHDALYERLEMPDTLDPKSKTAASTPRRILLNRQLTSIRKSLSANAGKNIVGKWFDSSNPGRISVASNLNSCLIKAVS
ncbi:MAG: hypothetical protein ABR969_00865 [Sedimentisphaerales bacterium]|jgi:hypothetical protein